MNRAKIATIIRNAGFLIILLSVFYPLGFGLTKSIFYSMLITGSLLIFLNMAIRKLDK